jgi:hypothetical protein
MESPYYLTGRPIWTTVLYVVLFPVMLWMALWWWASTTPTCVWDWLIAFTWFWMPISIPFSIYFMWSKYLKGEYGKMHDFRLLLPLAMIAFLVVNITLNVLRDYFQ